MFKITLAFCLCCSALLCHAADLSYTQWRMGWTVLDTAGVISAWHGAQQSDKDDGDIRRYRADGFKAAVGLADIYWLNPAPQGAFALYDWRRAAYRWQAHMPALAFNTALAAYVNHGGHRGEAEAFFISGIISAELYIWSKTWLAEDMYVTARDRQLVFNWQF
ncbi:MAG: hypothetical protein H7A09_10815 [Oceanospirillaceae bacterium]|nr:hypothetical protein [Oceanospirillaceae bacterium]MCP5349689.1 hypothetical protein [Oceanospirillaceae bacterium]